MTSIYELFDPRTPEVAVYVGKTRRPRERYAGHLKYPCNNGLRCLVEDLKQVGLKPGFRIIETVDDLRWEEREKFWIASRRLLNPSLLNILDGGNQFPDDVSARGGRLGGLKRKGKTPWNKTIKVKKARQRIFVFPIGHVTGGRHWTRVHPEKMRPLRGKDHPMFGRVYSDEERATQSAKLKGRPQSEETRMRMKVAQSNPLQRALNSMTVTKALSNPEVRARIRRGVRAAFTPEFLEHRRESQRRYAQTPEGRERGRRAGAIANHLRWHVRREKYNLACSLCYANEGTLS